MRQTTYTPYIKRRFPLYILLILIGFGFCFALFETFQTGKEERNDIQSTIVQVKKSHLPFLINSLWITDKSLVQTQLEAIARFPYIARVELTDDEGMFFYSGSDPDRSMSTQKETLTYSYKERELVIGHLTLFIDSDLINRTVRSKLFIGMASHVVLAVITVFIVFFLFNRMIGKPLNDITCSLEKDTPENFHKELQLTNKRKNDDEFVYLLDTINAFRSDLKVYIDSQNMLIREVHHRMKNNMTTISSILALQQAATENDDARNILEEAIGRLNSMALLYDKLYRPEIVTDISARDYLDNLAAEITDNVKRNTEVTLNINIPDCILPTKILFTLGILLNELITNSYKHAFTHLECGIIDIYMSINDDDILLTYRDNGPGIPASVLEAGEKGLGFTLIEAMIFQLHGNMKIENDNGTRLTFLFPLTGRIRQECI